MKISLLRMISGMRDDHAVDICLVNARHASCIKCNLDCKLVLQWRITAVLDPLINADRHGSVTKNGCVAHYLLTPRLSV